MTYPLYASEWSLTHTATTAIFAVFPIVVVAVLLFAGGISDYIGRRYSAADITALVTVDFAKALELSVPADHAALKRWYETVSSRPSAAA
jgi:MFS family permease